ncbi:MAG: hypothetical protein AB203_01610 [Parcubacteria bacterium C7867-008]|nr:MAG: hypothetical protein AB203_01610 [Parcubacteria bacterium C7867-008]
MKSLATRNAILALVITLLIIGSVVYAVNYLDRQRVAELSSIQNQLATDTLSVETQFALLESAPCEDISEGNTLSQEVSNLGEKLSTAESRLGATDEQVIQLKNQYTLLEIRDYLLTKRLAEACNFKPTVALYFYSNIPGACTDCDRASYALSYLHDQNPNLRVYSFDYNLNLGALKTLIAVEKVKPEFPAFVIEGKRAYGFTTIDDFKSSFPKDFFATSTTATSTSKKK